MKFNVNVSHVKNLEFTWKEIEHFLGSREIFLGSRKIFWGHVKFFEVT